MRQSARAERERARAGLVGFASVSGSELRSAWTASSTFSSFLQPFLCARLAIMINGAETAPTANSEEDPTHLRWMREAMNMV
jgi:hypothetical protein